LKIGIIGLGVVGNACKNGFEKNGYDICVHDIKLETTINDVLNTDICFISVPTPARDNGSCDVSIVQNVVDDLYKLNYNGIIAIKSTVEPGTTKKLQDKYGDLTICFVPEFLRERCADDDFVKNHDLCVIGTSSDEIFQLIKKIHGSYPKKVIQVSETEAELCKYFNNSYNATLITFANSFYELCKNMNVDYTNIKNTMIHRENIEDNYLGCDENLRGFGGMCLPKDVNALNYLSNKLGTNTEFFKHLIEENKKYKTTVFEGMRKE
jgi:UDPglucose 6-dehydrogenase